MRPAVLALLVLSATPAAAQVRQDPRPVPSPTPTRAVARSGRLVTERDAHGRTLSYNCNRPENAKRAVCRGAGDRPAVMPR